MKTKVSFRFKKSIKTMVDEMAEEREENKTAIVEDAIASYYYQVFVPQKDDVFKWQKKRRDSKKNDFLI